MAQILNAAGLLRFASLPRVLAPATVAVGSQQANASETLIRTSRLDNTWSRIGTVKVQLTGIQECSLTAHIADFHTVVGAQLPSHLQIPVLNVRVNVLAVRRD